MHKYETEDNDGRTEVRMTMDLAEYDVLLSALNRYELPEDTIGHPVIENIKEGLKEDMNP